MYEKKDVLMWIETIAILVIVIFALVMVGNAAENNGKLKMCKSLGMVFTTDYECITYQEYENLNNINNNKYEGIVWNE